MDFSIKSELQDRDATGGATREVTAEICLSDTLSYREARRLAIYEALGCMKYAATHKELDEVSTALQDVLDGVDALFQRKSINAR